MTKKNLVLNSKPKTYFLFDYSLPQNGRLFPKFLPTLFPEYRLCFTKMSKFGGIMDI